MAAFTSDVTEIPDFSGMIKQTYPKPVVREYVRQLESTVSLIVEWRIPELAALPSAKKILSMCDLILKGMVEITDVSFASLRALVSTFEGYLDDYYKAKVRKAFEITLAPFCPADVALSDSHRLHHGKDSINRKDLQMALVAGVYHRLLMYLATDAKDEREPSFVSGLFALCENVIKRHSISLDEYVVDQISNYIRSIGDSIDRYTRFCLMELVNNYTLAVHEKFDQAAKSTRPSAPPVLSSIFTSPAKSPESDSQVEQQQSQPHDDFLKRKSDELDLESTVSGDCTPLNAPPVKRVRFNTQTQEVVRTIVEINDNSDDEDEDMTQEPPSVKEKQDKANDDDESDTPNPLLDTEAAVQMCQRQIQTMQATLAAMSKVCDHCKKQIEKKLQGDDDDDDDSDSDSDSDSDKDI